jgi:hypothetical protein
MTTTNDDAFAVTEREKANIRQFLCVAKWLSRPDEDGYSIATRLSVSDSDLMFAAIEAMADANLRLTTEVISLIRHREEAEV